MAQNFLPTPVSTLTPDALDAQKIMRRQGTGRSALQSSAQPINPQRMSGRFMSAVSPLRALQSLQRRPSEQWSRSVQSGRWVNLRAGATSDLPITCVAVFSLERKARRPARCWTMRMHLTTLMGL